MCFSYVYFTDWGLTPFIARIGMDGTMFKRLVMEKLGWPNAITIDYITNKLIWADAHLNVIEMSDMEGNNRRKVGSFTTKQFVRVLKGLNIKMDSSRF